MKYYVDLEWADGFGSYSYEITPTKFFNSIAEAQEECDFLNENEELKDNELYCVAEIED